MSQVVAHHVDFAFGAGPLLVDADMPSKSDV
jgi:hypothetical protein